MRIAIYARVSDDKLTEDGLRRQDVNRQVDLIKAYCERKSYEIGQIYIDDGKSAWTDDFNARPAFNDMLSQVRQGHVKKIIVESLDRFSSNLVEGMRWLEEVAKHGATVESLQHGEHEVTSDDGWMKSGIFLLFAEYRIRNLRSKVKSGMSRAKDDERKKCHSCGIVHIGRHPLVCGCKKCQKKG